MNESQSGWPALGVRPTVHTPLHEAPPCTRGGVGYTYHLWSPCPLPCPAPSWTPFLQLPVQLLDSQALFVCGRLGSTVKWEIWPPVEDLWAPDPESRTASITVLINPDWPQCRTRGLVGRDRTGLSRWIQGQEGEAGRQRGDLRLAVPNLARSVFTVWPCGMSPPPADTWPVPTPGEEATGPAWARAGCLKTGAGAGWIGFPEAIYIYKGCRVPWSWPLPEGATLGGPARHAFLPRGWLSIYSPRQAGQGELRREGWKGWREKRALPPSLLPKEPLIVKARSKLGQGEVCPCSRSHSPPPCLALRWKKRCWGKPPP